MTFVRSSRTLAGIAVAVLVASPHLSSAQPWTAYGPEGASALALAIHPSTPSTAFLAAGNGIYRSTDAGASWLRVYDPPTGFGGVVSIAQDPLSASILYGSSSAGVSKTVDGGATWSLSNSGLTSTYVVALAVAPSNPAILYAATYGAPDAIHRSTNAGASWSVVDTTLSSVRALAIDPSNSNVAYAATSFGGIYKTTNGGSTWTAVNTGLPGGGYYDVAIDPVTPTTLWAASFFAGVYKSTNAGASWSMTDPAVAGFTIEFDPAAPATVYIAGGTVHKTTNGGATWSDSDAGLASANIYDVTVVPGGSANVFASTGKGLFKSNDGGTTWAASDAGIVNSFAFTVASAASAPHVAYAGMSWRSAVYRTGDGGLTWEARAAGMPDTQVGGLAVDPQSADAVYAAVGSYGVYKTTDGGISWSPANGGLPANRIVGSVSADPQNGQIAYVGTSNPKGIFRTANGGATWSGASSGLPASDSIGRIVVDPSNSAVLYVCTSSNVYKSVDSGSSWTLASTGLPAPAFPGATAIALDPASPSTLYLDRNDSLYKSTDGALTWSLAASLPGGAAQLTDVAVDPSSPGVVYVSTIDGVLRSGDGGTTFSPSASASGSFVVALTVASSGRAYAATWADGVYVLEKIDCPPTPYAGCKSPIAPQKSTLGLTLAPIPQRDLVSWRWTKGAVTTKAEFGDPLATNDYALCVYDRASGVATLALQAHAPAGGICGTQSCWKESNTGFKYVNRSGSFDGLTQLTLKEGLVPGRATITAKAQGASVGMPDLPLAQSPSVTAQLISATGCWTASYGSASTNSSSRFRSKSD